MRGTYLTTLARQLTRVVCGLPAGRAAEEFVLPAVLGAMGQTLHCTAGVGLAVARDGTVIRLHPGDTVWTAPGEEHWHGACADNMMSHYAMLDGTGDGDGTTWLEPVTDEEYRGASRP